MLVDSSGIINQRAVRVAPSPSSWGEARASFSPFRHKGARKTIYTTDDSIRSHFKKRQIMLRYLQFARYYSASNI